VLADFDLDGASDLIVANALPLLFTTSQYELLRQPVGTWRGTPDNNFEPVKTSLGSAAARGLLAADFDDDGDLDLVMTDWMRSPRLFENTTVGGRSVRVRLRGETSNREGIGATVAITLTDGRILTRTVAISAGVGAWGPTDVHFGLGNADIVSAEVWWPGGTRQPFEATINTLVTVRESFAD